MEILKDYFAGQYNGGWDGNFAQRGIETLCDVLYLDFYSDDFHIETEDELESSLESKQDNEMQLEM